MNEITEREKWDIGKIAENSNYYSSLSESHRTAAVSTAAVLASGYNLEYVPEAVLNKNICRAALKAKDADCTILPHIPFPEVQKEGIRKFERKIEPFVLYSFIDITDVSMAKEAVKADGACLPFVPDKLLTEEICRAAILNSNIGIKILDYIPDKFFTPPVCEAAVKIFTNGYDWLPKDKQTPELLSLAKKEHTDKETSLLTEKPQNYKAHKKLGF
jgi:hypothetical protein